MKTIARAQRKYLLECLKKWPLTPSFKAKNGIAKRHPKAPAAGWDFNLLPYGTINGVKAYTMELVRGGRKAEE